MFNNFPKVDGKHDDGILSSSRLYELTKTHDFVIDPEWLKACGIKDPRFSVPLEVLSISQFYAHNGAAFIQVKTPTQPKEGWCIDARRGEWVPKAPPVPAEVLEDRQVVISADQYNKEMILSVPPRSEWSTWRTPKMREAKRCVKQIEKLMREGNGSVQWFEGWANQPGDKPKNGLLSFGSDLSNRIKLSPKQIAFHSSREPYGRWDTPEYRQQSAFKDWLYEMAEAIGFETTSADQTSMCAGCNLAVDTGSSTPDHYALVGCEILCSRCANEDLSNVLEAMLNDTCGIVYLGFRPKMNQRFDYDSSLCNMSFSSRDMAERFAKQFLTNRMAIYGHGHNDCEAYFFTKDLSFEVSETQEPWSNEVWFANHARIEWQNAWRYPVTKKSEQAEAWEWLEERCNEDETPLLYWFTKGWIEEGVLFARDMDKLDELIELLAKRHSDSVEGTRNLLLALQVSELNEGEN